VIHRDVAYSRTDSRIEVAFLAERFSDTEIEAFADRLPEFGLDNTSLNIRQNSFALTEEEWTTALNEIRGDEDKVSALEARLEAEQQSFESPARLLGEARAINQLVQNIAIGTIESGTAEASAQDQTIVLLYTDATATPLTISEADGFKLWLQTRLRADDLLLIVSPQPTVPARGIDTVTQE